MTIQFSELDLSNALVDYARKKMGIDLTLVKSVEFRTGPFQEIGKSVVISTNLIHMVSAGHENLTDSVSSLDKRDAQARVKTRVIPTQRIVEHPTWGRKFK